MIRTLFHGGLLFDGTGVDPRPADVVIDASRIVAVGAPGTGDGDTAIDLAGRTLLPGLFDCHVHVMFSGVDIQEELTNLARFEHAASAMTKFVTTIDDMLGTLIDRL